MKTGLTELVLAEYMKATNHSRRRADVEAARQIVGQSRQDDLRSRTTRETGGEIEHALGDRSQEEMSRRLPLNEAFPFGE